jgi:hypothetical protein
MRYCSKCFEEYRDDVTRCASCDATLVSRDELEKLTEFKRTQGIEVKRFLKVGTADDPFDSEAFCEALAAEGIPVYARAKSRIDGAADSSWWEIMVPEEKVQAAEPVLTKLRAELRAAEEEAGKAAETEELEGEKGVAGRPNGAG